MRVRLAILLTIMSTAAVAAAGDELVTAPNAILCMNEGSLDTASAAAVAKSQTVLRAMGCLRSEAGIRISIVVRNAPNGAWQVRFYPSGIDGGVVLWGRPSSFVGREAAQSGPARRI